MTPDGSSLDDGNPDEQDGGATAQERLDADHRRGLARIAVLEAQVARILDTASASSGDDEHDPEGQTIAYDRAQDPGAARRRPPTTSSRPTRPSTGSPAGPTGPARCAGARSVGNGSWPDPRRGGASATPERPES